MRVCDFPLAWPEGRGRIDLKDRAPGRFRVDFRRAYNDLVEEAEGLHEGPGEVVLSTNLPLGKSGLPLVATSGRLADPGAALYVRRGGRVYALACDAYLDVAHNLRAIWATVRALRTIERHGTRALLEQSMVGHQAEVGGLTPVRLLASGG